MITCWKGLNRQNLMLIQSPEVTGSRTFVQGLKFRPNKSSRINQFCYKAGMGPKLLHKAKI